MQEIVKDMRKKTTDSFHLGSAQPWTVGAYARFFILELKRNFETVIALCGSRTAIEGCSVLPSWIDRRHNNPRRRSSR